MKQERIAEVRLITEGLQSVLKVTVPKGTTLADTVRLQPELSKILGKLKGCLPCNSGVPIWFQEQEEIARTVKIDLESFKEVG